MGDFLLLDFSPSQRPAVRPSSGIAAYVAQTLGTHEVHDDEDAIEQRSGADILLPDSSINHFCSMSVVAAPTSLLNATELKATSFLSESHGNTTSRGGARAQLDGQCSVFGGGRGWTLKAHPSYHHQHLRLLAPLVPLSTSPTLYTQQGRRRPSRQAPAHPACFLPIMTIRGLEREFAYRFTACLLFLTLLLPPATM